MQELIDKLRRLLGERRYAYQQTFKGPLAEKVLRDLARFCRANESTFHVDDRAHAVAEGRREVWLRIQHHIRLTERDLWERYSGQSEDK